MGIEEKREEKEIGGIKYSMVPLPFSLGRPALVRLLKVVSPIFGAVMRAGSGGEQAAAVFESLPTALSDDDLKYFAKLFGDTSRYEKDGVWVPLITENQELHFAGQYLEFMQWIAFGCQCNFSGFFAGVMSKGGAASFMTMMQPSASK